MQLRKRMPAQGWEWAIWGAYAAAPVLGVGAYYLLEWGSEESGLGGVPEFSVWQLIIVAQLILWAVLAAVGLSALRDLHIALRAWLPDHRWKAATVTQVIYGYAIVIVPLVLYEQAVGGPAAGALPAKILAFTILGFLVALPHVVILKRVQLAAEASAGWGTAIADVRRMRELRRLMQASTAALGIIIAFAVLATGALHEAIAAAYRAARRAGATPEEATGLQPFPEVFILLYGVLFTGLLAGIYLHVSRALDRRARAIVERAAPMADPDIVDASSFVSIQDQRSALSAELELGGDLRQNLEGAIAVLSPLATAVLTRLAGV